MTCYIKFKRADIAFTVYSIKATKVQQIVSGKQLKCLQDKVKGPTLYLFSGHFFFINSDEFTDQLETDDHGKAWVKGILHDSQDLFLYFNKLFMLRFSIPLHESA